MTGKSCTPLIFFDWRPSVVRYNYYPFSGGLGKESFVSDQAFSGKKISIIQTVKGRMNVKSDIVGS